MTYILLVLIFLLSIRLFKVNFIIFFLCCPILVAIFLKQFIYYSYDSSVVMGFSSQTSTLSSFLPSALSIFTFFLLGTNFLDISYFKLLRNSSRFKLAKNSNPIPLSWAYNQKKKLKVLIFISTLSNIILFSWLSIRFGNSWITGVRIGGTGIALGLEGQILFSLMVFLSFLSFFSILSLNDSYFSSFPRVTVKGLNFTREFLLKTLGILLPLTLLNMAGFRGYSIIMIIIFASCLLNLNSTHLFKTITFQFIIFLLPLLFFLKKLLGNQDLDEILQIGGQADFLEVFAVSHSLRYQIDGSYIFNLFNHFAFPLIPALIRRDLGLETLSDIVLFKTLGSEYYELSQGFNVGTLHALYLSTPLFISLFISFVLGGIAFAFSRSISNNLISPYLRILSLFLLLSVFNLGALKYVYMFILYIFAFELLVFPIACRLLLPHNADKSYFKTDW